jgi:hypothetical protein
MAQHTQSPHTTHSTTPTPPGQWTTDIPYASDNYLQTYDVFPTTSPSNTTPTSPCSSSTYWLIYIHGGFFRDPLVDASSFHATISHLHATTPPDSPERALLAGYASINYRLSAHPEHTQQPNTPRFSRRQAAWPAHLDDVLTALATLQARYGFGARYILAGHSVGAQLALLAALRCVPPPPVEKRRRRSGLAAAQGEEEKEEEQGGAQRRKVPEAPTVVLGISGIYDFPLIHEDHPEYTALTFGAMRRGEEVLASPARYELGEYVRVGVKRVVLAHSRDDGLVPWNQVGAMAAVLGERCAVGQGGEIKGISNSSEGGQAGDGEFVSVLELKGEHNEIWRDGRESSRAVLEALRFVVR